MSPYGIDRSQCVKTPQRFSLHLLWTVCYRVNKRHIGDDRSCIRFCVHGMLLSPCGNTFYLTRCQRVGLGGFSKALRWRHWDHDGVSNHQPGGCLLIRLFRRRSKKTSKLRVTGLCAGNSPGPANSPHKGPVTRKMFPFDDAIMEVAAFIHVGGPLIFLWPPPRMSE